MIFAKNRFIKKTERSLPWPSVFCFMLLAQLLGCSDFMVPVEPTSSPTEYSYNYWLLDRTYLFEDELPKLNPEGDSVQLLYAALDDPFTRYIPPSKSESVSISINTSIVQGDIGIEIYTDYKQSHPLYIYRVYPKGPAGMAGVPRYGNILNVNGVELTGTRAEAIYDSVLAYNKEIRLTVAKGQDTLELQMEKDNVYAPTIFLDTFYTDTTYTKGLEVLTIREFKPTTVDKSQGTYGELKDYLDSTANQTTPRILDLRSNPGGHVNQCIAMADLFVSSGPLSTRTWRTFGPDGEKLRKSLSVNAVSGDPGEKGKFIVLVDKNSASCAEIFTAAIAEGANIPIVGTSTYGKGIGQTTWKTKVNGLAIITNLEFLTPKGNSYHKKGLKPDYDCGKSSTLNCAFGAVEKYYGGFATFKSSFGLSNEIIQPTTRQNKFLHKEFFGGAIEESDILPPL